MNTYIAEIAGKDSIAALIRFMKTHPTDIIIPTVAFSGTEYGDFGSYDTSIDFLNRYARQMGVKMTEKVVLEDYELWNVLCIKYQYLINKNLGFFSSCIMCHFYLHLLRVPIYKSNNSVGIITGERMHHETNQKANQHKITIDCFDKIFERYNIFFNKPLYCEYDNKIIDGEINNKNIVSHANDLKCSLSGNLYGFNLKDEKNIKKMSDFLNAFLLPIGEFCVSEMILNNTINIETLNSKILGVIEQWTR